VLTARRRTLAIRQLRPDDSGPMNLDSELRNFEGLSALEKARLLVHFMYEMTLEARNFYAAGGEQPIDVHKMRFIIEVQHRVTRFIEQILTDDPARSSDEMMLRLLLAPRTEKAIEGLVLSAYTRTIQAIS
jgi:hypothetical protein